MSHDFNWVVTFQRKTPGDVPFSIAYDPDCDIIVGLTEAQIINEAISEVERPGLERAFAGLVKEQNPDLHITNLDDDYEDMDYPTDLNFDRSAIAIRKVTRDEEKSIVGNVCWIA